MLTAHNPRFERLYRSHVRTVYRYALVVTGNPADAEDVTQTTFMNAYRAISQGQKPSKPENWLMTIAHNVLRQRARQSMRRPDTVELDGDFADPVAPADDTPSAADLQRALGHLAFNQRSALVMRELEGRSYAEIAQVLDLTVNAVEMLIFRARRALREQLEGMLTCEQAQEALSLDLDGQLPDSDRPALRAHLRECPECARIARRERARGTAWRMLAAAPLPASLAPSVGSLISAGVGVAAKAIAVTVAAATVAGGGYVVAEHTILAHPGASGPARHHVVARAHARHHAAPPARTVVASSPARSHPFMRSLPLQPALHPTKPAQATPASPAKPDELDASTPPALQPDVPTATDPPSTSVPDLTTPVDTAPPPASSGGSTQTPPPSSQPHAKKPLPATAQGTENHGESATTAPGQADPKPPTQGGKG